MPKKKKSGHVAQAMPSYGSDDERAYEKEAVPDPKSREYYYDEVDEFHANREKILLDHGVRDDKIDDMEEEEEILGVGHDDDDLMSDEEIQNYKKQLRRLKQSKRKDELGSDLEEEEDEEEGLPDTKAWGARRSKYYGADVSDDEIDMSGSEGSDIEETAAVMEEKEALALQKKMAAELDDQDFGLELFQSTEKEDEEKDQEKIVKDLSKMSKREKLQLLKKESPELLTLIDEFKSKMTEVRDVLQPLRQLIQDKHVRGKAVDYVNTKFKLYLNYCTNISFYMMLKAKQLPVHNHPVIKRLVQYRNLMKQLEPVDEQLQTEVNEILTKLRNGEDVNFVQVETTKPATFVRRKSSIVSRQKAEQRKLSQMVSDSEDENNGDTVPSGGRSKKKRPTEAKYETEGEKEALAYYDMLKSGKKTTEPQEEEDSDMEAGETEERPEGMADEDEQDDETKRGITYQIEKNKGLTKHKRKELRNPRVKHKLKYRKAKIRRRGQIREVRTEMTRYGGEASGIRAAIKRGSRERVQVHKYSIPDFKNT